MGKVFVKGPVESPDDLLAKQAMAQRLQNFKQGMGPKLGAGFEHARNYAGTRNYGGAFQESLSSAGRLANNQIDDFGQLTQAIFDPFFTLFGRKPQTPEEEERSRQMIKDKIREERQPAMDAQAALAAKEKEEVDNQALLGRFQNLSQRKGAEAAQLSGHKGATDLADYEEYARQNYPGMPLNEVANMLGQQFTNVEAESLRRQMKGKNALAGYGAEQTAQGLETASNAAEGEATPLPNVNVDHLVDPSSNPVPDLMNTLNDTESPKIPNGNMDQGVVTQVPQVTAGPPAELSSGQGYRGQEEHHANEENKEGNMDPLRTPGAGVQSMNVSGDKKEEPDLSTATTGGATRVPPTDFSLKPELPTDVQTVFSGNDALAQMQRDQGRD